MSEKISLTGVPETMLQTVYARAKETKTRGAIHDEAAAALIDKLDYDFSAADHDAAMHSGVIARTIVLDRLTQDYLQQHPGAAVVNIACGLDTRCYRMEGYSHWYNLDLPETIAVRAAFAGEGDDLADRYVRHGAVGRAGAGDRRAGADHHRGPDHVPDAGAGAGDLPRHRRAV